MASGLKRKQAIEDIMGIPVVQAICGVLHTEVEKDKELVKKAHKALLIGAADLTAWREDRKLKLRKCLRKKAVRLKSRSAAWNARLSS
jgi:hypothetical protein